MCINPARLPDGTEFACRKCWQCRENKIQDWVGRCIAQSKTSSHTYAVTLTYGGGDLERATVLTYSDVQKYFKRLRRAGFKFRYLVAGEYGSLKGRAHWHLILFFDGPAPKHEIRKNFSDPYWGHGHSFWDEPSAKALRYVCKYVRKDEGDQEAQAHFAMSKKPPIGSEYFAQLAQQQVDNGLSPKDLMYDFDENRDKDGKKVQHYMHGATARDFLEAFIAKWENKYGNRNWPYSQMLDGGEDMDGYLDKIATYCPDPVMAKYKYAPYPEWVPFRGCELVQSEPHNTFYTEHGGHKYWWRPMKDQKQEEWAWHGEQGTVIRWEASDRYKDLTRSSEQRKQQLDKEQATLKSGVNHSPLSHLVGPTGRRIPMVGDSLFEPLPKPLR